MAKSGLKRVLLAGGILRMAARLLGKGAAILMYHSVLDDPSEVHDSLGQMIHQFGMRIGLFDWTEKQHTEFLPGDFYPMYTAENE